MADDGNVEKAADLCALITHKSTLSIWDVPPELAREFVHLAQAKYGKKSWLCLQDLMEKAKKYDALHEDVAKLEARVAVLECPKVAKDR